MATNKSFSVTKINPLLLLVGFVFILAMLFWVAKSVLSLLSWASPVLFLAAIVINYRVVIGYGKWLLASLKRNPIFGIAAILFSVLGFPLVSIFLLLRAIATRGVANPMDDTQFSPYEEVEEDFLDISKIKEYEKRVDNDYNDVF